MTLAVIHRTVGVMDRNGDGKSKYIYRQREGHIEIEIEIEIERRMLRSVRDL